MIRHLIGGGPDRRDVLTECGETSALPGTLMTRIEDVNCRACKTSLIHRGICPACGEKALAWNPHPKKLTGVVDGRLRASDVETIFYLSCDYCSETLIPEVSPREVAEALTAMKWTPR